MSKKTIIKKVVVDFVARGTNESEWLVVLVEQLDAGAVGDISRFLNRLQDRLYDCLDAILDGSLADRYPETLNNKVIIRVDCYNAPEDDVLVFFNAFSSGVLKIPDYSAALEDNAFVSNVAFQINFDNA